MLFCLLFFFFNDTATTEIYTYGHTLSLHDALPIFAPADAAPRSAERLRQWLDACHHGEMLWMEERAGQRGSPQGLWPDVRSVVMLGMSYAPGRDPLALADARDRGRISVYAQGRDRKSTRLNSSH